MNILKPKKTDFNTKLGIALQKIYNKLKAYKCICSVTGSTMTVSEFDKSDKYVIDIIEDTVTEVFECKKSKKYCKLNYFNNKLYIRFKNKREN